MPEIIMAQTLFLLFPLSPTSHPCPPPSHSSSSLYFSPLSPSFMQLFSSLTMQSLVHTSQSWSTPATKLWVGGSLELRQRVPLPATGRVEQYNTSLFNANSSFAADYEISTILSRYNARNGELSSLVFPTAFSTTP